MDGTLVDSVPTILACFERAFAEVRDGPAPTAEFRRWIGTPLRRGFEAVSNDDTEIDALMEAYKRAYVDATRTSVPMFPGAIEAVRTLRARGLKTAIVTSKSRQGTDRTLTVAKLVNDFDATISADDVTRGKPDPEPVHRALDLLGVDATRAWFIGDAPHDITAGAAAGVRTAAVHWGPYTPADFEAQAPDVWLHDFDALIRLVG